MAKTTRRTTKSREEYYGFLCANPACGMPILIGQIPRDEVGRGVEIASNRAEHRLTCPICGHTAAYRSELVQRFRVAGKGQLH